MTRKQQTVAGLKAKLREVLEPLGKERGMTDLADAIDVSRALPYRWMDDSAEGSIPDAIQLQRLATLVGRKVTWFLGEDEEPEIEIPRPVTPEAVTEAALKLFRMLRHASTQRRRGVKTPLPHR